MTKYNPEVHNELISAYVDGEVDEREKALVERILKESPAARRLYDDLKRHSQVLSGLPRHGAPSAIVDDIRLRLERAELLEGPDLVVRGSGRRKSGFGRWLAAATIGGLLIGGGWWTWQSTMKTSARREAPVALAPGKPTERAFEQESEAVAKKTMATKSREIPPPAKETTSSTTASTREHARPDSRKEIKDESAPVVWRNPSELKDLGGKTLAQKSPTVNEIRSLPFETQELRLQVSVVDDAAKKALTHEIVQQVSAQGARVLTKFDSESGVSGRKNESVVYEGKVGVNFSDAAQSQILVRAPAERINELVEMIAQRNSGRQSISLLTQGQKINDMKVAQGMLSAREQKVQEGAIDESTRADRARKKSIDEPGGVPEFGLFGGLIRAMGLDAALQRPSSVPSTPDISQSGAMANRPISTTTESAASDTAHDSRGDAPPTQAPGAIVANQVRRLFRQQAQGVTQPSEFVGPVQVGDSPSTMMTASISDNQDDLVTIVIEVKVDGPTDSDTSSTPAESDSQKTNGVPPKKPVPR